MIRIYLKKRDCVSIEQLLSDINFHNYLHIYLYTIVGQNILDPDTAELWVASRVFDRSQNVGDRLGRNEKTKVSRHRLFIFLFLM